MRAAGFLLAGLLTCAWGAVPQRDTPRFQKVSDALLFLESAGGSSNLAALVTDEGVLLIDTPGERQAPDVLEALRRVSPKPVRWVVNTHSHADHVGGNRYFLSRGVDVIGSRGQWRLMTEGSGTPGEGHGEDATAGAATSAPRIMFERQMRLFPGGIEVRLLALPHRAHTAADTVLFVPAENALMAGDIFIPGSFPEIDSTGAGGNAAGWIDALRRAIEFVPLVKPAIPAPKPVVPVPPEEEKTLEELVVVLPGHGPASNLKEMKDLLEAAQRIRGEASRAVSAGRSRQSFVASSSIAAYRRYGNLEAFAGELYDALSKK